VVVTDPVVAVVGEAVVESSPGTAKAVAKLPDSVANGTASTVSAAAIRFLTVSPNADDCSL
jgi:hypothetical protein